jgi:hypothetical protein
VKLGVHSGARPSPKDPQQREQQVGRDRRGQQPDGGGQGQDGRVAVGQGGRHPAPRPGRARPPWAADQPLGMSAQWSSPAAVVRLPGPGSGGPAVGRDRAALQEFAAGTRTRPRKVPGAWAGTTQGEPMRWPWPSRCSRDPISSATHLLLSARRAGPFIGIQPQCRHLTAETVTCPPSSVGRAHPW